MSRRVSPGSPRRRRSPGLMRRTQVMRQQESGLAGPLGPLELIDHLPFKAFAASDRRRLVMQTQTASVGKRAPQFELPCTRGPGSARPVRLAAYRDRWLILVFYPRDFSLVCPTELTVLSARVEELCRRGCDI